jgi:uncharacterized protein (TIGR02145 family)
MQKNLNVCKYRNGDDIPQVQDRTQWANLKTGAWCYYENNTSNGPVYGKLYNWYAVNDPRGLAPTGYHIPTDAEWTTLIKFLGGEILAGGKMKVTGTSLWISPNTDATNSSSFTGIPGGIRKFDGGFEGMGERGSWWSATEQDSATNTSNAFYNSLYNFTGAANRSYFFKPLGFSIRCVRD